MKKKLETTSDGVVDQSIYTLGELFDEEDKMKALFEKITHFRKSTLVSPSNIHTLQTKINTKAPKLAKI